ncbi:MAG: alpha/beta hydrolase [Phycisphaerae bacterium]
MALANLSYFSPALKTTTALTAILPDSGPGPFPVFYLLHGLGDDHTIWSRRTSIERYVSGIPLIVVMPGTARGWYTNAATPPGLPYEDHLTTDVLSLVDRLFPTIPRREGRVIGGLSMGGYGAIKLALKFPDLFCSATSHSGPLMTPLHKPELRPKEFAPQLAEYQSIFGADWQGGPNDPAALAKKCPLHLRPALRIDCGLSDFLLDQNREFHTHLDALHFPHEYHEFEGEHNCTCCGNKHTCTCDGGGPLNPWSARHDWAYWDRHIQDAILFHCKNLRIKLPD